MDQEHLHIVFISTNGEGKTTLLLWLFSTWFACLEGTRCEYGFLEMVECNSAKLLPVTDQRLFREDLMDCDSSL